MAQHVKAGTGCPFCLGRKGRDVSYYQEIAKNRGFECLATEYVGVDVKIPWRCAKMHIWETNSDNIKRGRGCPVCAGRAGRDVSFYQEIAKNRGIECLATEYVGVDVKIPWRCAKGHTWKGCADKIKRGNGCPVCAGKKPKGVQLPGTG